jgi:pyruvate,water dikinase
MARFVREHPPLEDLFARTPTEEILETLQRSADGRVVKQRFERFLAEFGNRAVREAEISTPRWHEMPSFLLEVIRTHLEAPYLPTTAELERERVTKRKETTEMIRQYFKPGLGVLFRRILARTQQNARLRETLRAMVTDTLAMYRHFFLAVGSRLVAERVLAELDDVFYLTRYEVEGYLRASASVSDLTLAVATRRAEYVAFVESANPPDTFVLHAGDKIPEATASLPADTPLLKGLAASPGRVTGHARVIHDLTVDPHLHPGEILVAPFTDVGWTPLFLVAAAVVADIGGPLSHSSVVAREYGIPCVVNVKEATALIKTGDLITVDGDAGVVFLKH